MKQPLNWVERGFEHDGNLRIWTHVAAVPGGWLIRSTTLVQTKIDTVSVSTCMEFIPGFIEHPASKAKPKP